MYKIQRVSSFFRALFQALFIALPILLALFWVNAPHPVGIPSIGITGTFIPKVDILHMLSPETKILGFLICLIPMFFTELTLYFLIQLFKLYARGEIFSIQNVNYIKNVGYALLWGQIADPFYQALITLNLTWGNPHGHRIIAITLDQTNMGIILFAFLTILISWIMAEGCKLREEQQLTI